MANGYVSWYSGDDRTTYYTRWSVGCFKDDIYPIIERAKDSDSESAVICVLCGEAIKGDSETVFLTLFPPKLEQVDYEFECCPNVCFEALRNDLAKGGELRPDRTGRVGAQSQAPTPTSEAWGSFTL